MGGDELRLGSRDAATRAAPKTVDGSKQPEPQGAGGWAAMRAHARNVFCGKEDIHDSDIPETETRNRSYRILRRSVGGGKTPKRLRSCMFLQ